MNEYDTISQIALVLAVAFAGEAILRRLRQPALVGYIIAGIVMGPAVLGLISGDGQIKLLSDLAILLLLFIIGLELDLRSFVANYRVAIGTTAIQIAASLAVAVALGYFLDWPLAKAVVIGFALSLSSTAVAIKLLEDRGGLNAPAGQTALGILVAQDLAVIPMMLIIASFREGGFETDGIVKVVIAVAVMVVVSYILMQDNLIDRIPRLLRRPIGRLANTQSVIKGLAFCFAGAALSGALGLSASYGAFLAGLVVGSTQNHKIIEEQARPLFDVLMMVFFLSIGLMLDPAFIWEHIVSITILLFVAMFLKTILNIVTLRRFGVGRRSALFAGTLLGQVGEFSFILAALGFSIGAIKGDAYKYVVTLIALSLIVTPLWVYAFRRKVFLIRRWRHHRNDRRRARAMAAGAKT